MCGSIACPLLKIITINRMDRINTSFSDWDFVDRATDNNDSDDDSIVIIERETCKPLDSASITDNESENDEFNNFLEVSSDSHVPEKNLQAMETVPSTLQSITNRELFKQIIEVKLFHCVTSYLIVVSFVTIGLMFSTIDNAKPVDFNTLTQLRSSMRLRKTLIDDLFAYQVEMLNHMKRISHDIYSLNIRQFSQINQKFTLPGKENAIVNLLDSTSVDRPPCEEYIIPELLPVVCLENNDVILMLTEDQLMAAFDDIVNLLQETSDKYTSLDDSLIHALSTKPKTKFDEKTSKDSFVQDCDNFSKNYKPNFCMKTQDFDSCLKNAEGVCIDGSTFSFHKSSESEIENINFKDEKNINEDKKVTEEFKDFMTKFKDDFERLYRTYMHEIDSKMSSVDEKEQKNNGIEENDTSLYVSSDESDEITSVKNDIVASSHIPEKVGTTLTGEWLLNLNTARAKLREYYDKAVKSDWFLELGKSRENLRMHREHEKPTEYEAEKPFVESHRERSKKKDKSKSSDKQEDKEWSKKGEESERKKDKHKPWYKISWEDSKKWFKHENKPWCKMWENYRKWYKKNGEETSQAEDERKPWYKMSWEDSKKWFKKRDDNEKSWYQKSWEYGKGWYEKENNHEDTWYSWSKKPVDDAKEWYNKYDSKKLKNDFKKFTTKWKSHFKKLKEGILDNYEKYVPSHLQIDLRNMWYF